MTVEPDAYQDPSSSELDSSWSVIAEDAGRMLTYDKVAGIGVVGNEDGAHHVTAELCQALNDVGFTIPANGSIYWFGEAMQAVDYRDKKPTPEKTTGTTKTLAATSPTSPGCWPSLRIRQGSDRTSA